MKWIGQHIFDLKSKFRNDVDITGDVTITGTLDVSGISTSATHFVLGDDDKIKLGNGDDLEIYHDGSNSYISDTGTGSLVIKSSPIVEVKGANDENIARFIENGSVDLYYNNSLKFETTGGGALVIGELEATTLDINGGVYNM